MAKATKTKATKTAELAGTSDDDVRLHGLLGEIEDRLSLIRGQVLPVVIKPKMKLEASLSGDTFSAFTITGSYFPRNKTIDIEWYYRTKVSDPWIGPAKLQVAVDLTGNFKKRVITSRVSGKKFLLNVTASSKGDFIASEQITLGF